MQISLRYSLGPHELSIVGCANGLTKGASSFFRRAQLDGQPIAARPNRRKLHGQRAIYRAKSREKSDHGVAKYDPEIFSLLGKLHIATPGPAFGSQPAGRRCVAHLFLFLVLGGSVRGTRSPSLNSFLARVICGETDLCTKST